MRTFYSLAITLSYRAFPTADVYLYEIVQSDDVSHLQVHKPFIIMFSPGMLAESFIHVRISSASSHGSDEAMHPHSLARTSLLACTNYWCRCRPRQKVKPLAKLVTSAWLLIVVFYICDKYQTLVRHKKTRHRGYKTFSCSTELSTNFNCS